MSDLISRQDALDSVAFGITHAKAFNKETGEVMELFAEGNKELRKAVERIEQLPSAQPEPCEDTVSRQRLLSDLKELVAAWKKYPVMAEQKKGVEAAIGYVEAIPSAQPNLQPTCNQLATDCISRQDAITLPVMPKEHREYQTYNLDDAYEQGWNDLQKCIESLPSAQPESFEWCTDCKEYDQDAHCCPRWNRVIRETLKDAQPDLLEDGTLMMTVPQGMLENVKRVLVDEVGTKNCKVMYQDAERKKGNWNVIQGDIVVCSNCGMSAPESMTGCLVNRHLEPNRTKFCPNCGADMRGEEHETD